MSLCSSAPLDWNISEDPVVAPSQPSDGSDGGSRSFCKQLPASGLAHTAISSLVGAFLIRAQHKSFDVQSSLPNIKHNNERRRVLKSTTFLFKNGIGRSRNG
ncbi:unnamed protein product [Lactuca virosa]|uniref:Uncharacterized protein n=1 Tax=Lactuca virosa TaxID=75947 RepID=A0AAU9M5M0_9ASTR|nr:unnamed protein product [Lactuca virosa]